MIDRVIEGMLSFTGKRYTKTYTIASMIPGTLVFLVMSPFFLFFPARFLGNLVPVVVDRSVEMVVMAVAGSLALVLMNWSLLVLWKVGEGTPAPIAPTRRLVTIGPYGLVRNPIELGTDIYFLVLGTWFDSLATGFFCMLFGMAMGIGYIKMIEEKELMIRFGDQYSQYKNRVSMIIPGLL